MIERERKTERLWCSFLEAQRGEVYNKTDRTLIFTNRHPDRAKQPEAWQRIEVPPKKHVLFPHLAYNWAFPDGSTPPPGSTQVSTGHAIGHGITADGQWNPQEHRRQ